MIRERVPTTTNENVEETKAILLDNHWITVREAMRKLVPHLAHAKAINILAVKQVAVKCLPKLLDFQQKQHS